MNIQIFILITDLRKKFKGSLMLPLNKILYWIFVMHKLYLDIPFPLKQDRQILEKGSEQIFKYIIIFKNLQTNIQIYSVVQISTNEYPKKFILGKWHEYKCE